MAKNVCQEKKVQDRCFFKYWSKEVTNEWQRWFSYKLHEQGENDQGLEVNVEVTIKVNNEVHKVLPK